MLLIVRICVSKSSRTRLILSSSWKCLRRILHFWITRQKNMEARVTHICYSDTFSRILPVRYWMKQLVYVNVFVVPPKGNTFLRVIRTNSCISGCISYVPPLFLLNSSSPTAMFFFFVTFSTIDITIVPLIRENKIKRGRRTK